MPNRTFDELFKEYTKLTDGVVREVDNLDKKREKIEGSLDHFAKIVAGVGGAASLSDEDLVALGAEAMAAVDELKAAKEIVTAGRVNKTLAGHKGWIETALRKYTEGGPGKLSAILDDVRKLTAADREAFDAEARKGVVLAAMLEKYPELAGKSIGELWKVYAKIIQDWLKVVSPKVVRWVGHPEEFDAKVKKLNEIVKALTAILTARENERKRKAAKESQGGLEKFIKRKYGGTLTPSRDYHYKFPHWPM